MPFLSVWDAVGAILMAYPLLREGYGLNVTLMEDPRESLNGMGRNGGGNDPTT